MQLLVYLLFHGVQVCLTVSVMEVLIPSKSGKISTARVPLVNSATKSVRYMLGMKGQGKWLTTYTHLPTFSSELASSLYAFIHSL